MKKILIIEDDQTLTRVIAALLIKNGYEVFEAYDAMKGVQLARQEKPDLILLDIMLPAGDGETVLDRLKVSVQTSLIPVVLVTGLEDQDRMVALLAKGVKAIVKKPIDMTQLFEVIQKVC